MMAHERSQFSHHFKFYGQQYSDRGRESQKMEDVILIGGAKRSLLNLT